MYGVIFAVAPDGAIGLNNKLPWPPLKADMENFKRITLGANVIMGRRTWESLPEALRPLPGRSNYVLTRSLKAEQLRGAEPITFRQMMEMTGDSPRSNWVIGGADLITHSLYDPECTRAVVTHIHAPFDGDTYVRAVAEMSRHWEIVSTSIHRQGDIHYSISEYQRKSA